MSSPDVDPIEAVRIAFDEACTGLEPTATVRRAQAVVADCLKQIEANASLIVQHERPRQEQVRAERERRATQAKAEAERDAQAKAERVNARRARQAKGSKK